MPAKETWRPSGRRHLYDCPVPFAFHRLLLLFCPAVFVFTQRPMWWEELFAFEARCVQFIRPPDLKALEDFILEIFEIINYHDYVSFRFGWYTHLGCCAQNTLSVELSGLLYLLSYLVASKCWAGHFIQSTGKFVLISLSWLGIYNSMKGITRCQRHWANFIGPDPDKG